DVTLVTFPFGRLRLVTSPLAIGSAPVSNTIGVAVVTDFAARAALALPGVAITATCRRARSAAHAGKRSFFPPPTAIPSRRFHHRDSRPPEDLREMQQRASHNPRAIQNPDSRSPAPGFSAPDRRAARRQ